VVVFLEYRKDPWREHAGCVPSPVPVRIWLKPHLATARERAVMENTCSACPVRVECATDMETRQDWIGFRAGTAWRYRDYNDEALNTTGTRTPATKLHQIPRPCRYCGITYTPNEGTRNSVYCTDACRHKGARETKRRWKLARKNSGAA
jgi:hypothetical protein